MYAGNVCGALYLFSNKVALVLSFQKVCRSFISGVNLERFVGRTNSS